MSNEQLREKIRKLEIALDDLKSQVISNEIKFVTYQIGELEGTIIDLERRIDRRLGENHPSRETREAIRDHIQTLKREKTCLIEKKRELERAWHESRDSVYNNIPHNE